LELPLRTGQIWVQLASSVPWFRRVWKIGPMCKAIAC